MCLCQKREVRYSMLDSRYWILDARKKDENQGSRIEYPYLALSYSVYSATG